MNNSFFICNFKLFRNMANKILVLGPSGTGKSFAISFLDPKETWVICADKKPLPFRGSKKLYKSEYLEDGKVDIVKSNFGVTNNMKKIRVIINKVANEAPHIKTIIVDTVTHGMIASVMRELNNESWNKWKDFANEFYWMSDDIDTYRDDLVVIFNSHVEETDAPNGSKKTFKVPGGKLTKEVIDPESLFTVVLGSECSGDEENPTWFFVTQNNGHNTCKSPPGMFSANKIENNFQYVRDSVENYFNDDEMPSAKEVVIDEQEKF